MKAYPSIPSHKEIDLSTQKFYLFDKLDGSNIRAEWSAKKGFSKFGSRTQLLTEDQGILFPAIEAFEKKYGEELDRRFRAQKIDRAVVFFEWVGPGSFAGSHICEPGQMDAVVIDISVYKKGIMPPAEFIEFMVGLHTPKVLYHGFVTERVITEIRHRTLAFMTFEGVIGKGLEHDQKSGGPLMFKIKSYAWLDHLKTKCDGNEELFNRLK